jgi:molecular chaperone HtpG
MENELIPFKIDTQRIVQLLAKQIYQSPLALLRENAQNAFDAIRLRLHSGQQFDPQINIELHADKIVVIDNGIGMSREDLRTHFWCAGSSSKNNDTARAAGVVGTFGIGAMANFGIANALEVETESALTGERTRSFARLEDLDVTRDCVQLASCDSAGTPGTRVTATLMPETVLNIDQAKNYISEFVSLVAVPVYVNGDCVSKKPVDVLVPVVPETHKIEALRQQLGARLSADVTIIVSNNAEIWLSLSEIVWGGNPLNGRIVMRSGTSSFKTFRSGFGLATTSVSSHYQFGGVCDLRVLEPTAGREAITTEGMQLLQSIVVEIDGYVSALLATKPECDSSTFFMNWIVAHGKYDLCGMLKINVAPGDRVCLSEIRQITTTKTLPVYTGQDPSIIKQFASEDAPLLIIARSNPRHQCEMQYLTQYCKIESVSDAPQIVEVKKEDQWTSAESALEFRIKALLESDYFLSVSVIFGKISHGLTLLVEKSDSGVKIVIDSSGQATTTMIGLFENEYSAFSSMVKDYVRSVIFPRVADFVPSASRQGAEAFLNAIRRTREYVEYDDTDTDYLSKILEDYREGKIEFPQAIEMWKTSVQSGIQYVDENATKDVRAVVPDVIENESVLAGEAAMDQNGAPQFNAAPAILRQEISSVARLLVINENEPALRGHRCFLALTDNAYRQFGDFFLQPHRTSVVWGGQRTMFVFLHHSGQFGLYYDLLTKEPIDAVSGGGRFESATIVLKDRIFVPVPSAIMSNFIPKSGERKRLEVRADIIRTEQNGNGY